MICEIADFVSHIRPIKWNLLMCTSFNVNDKCQIFHETIHKCMVNCIPHIDVIMTDSDPPWFTPFLKYLINERWTAFRAGNYNRYCVLRNRIKRNWAVNSSNSTNNLWNVVNNVIGTKTGSF